MLISLLIEITKIKICLRTIILVNYIKQSSENNLIKTNYELSKNYLRTRKVKSS